MGSVGIITGQWVWFSSRPDEAWGLPRRQPIYYIPCTHRAHITLRRCSQTAPIICQSSSSRRRLPPNSPRPASVFTQDLLCIRARGARAFDEDSLQLSLSFFARQCERGGQQSSSRVDSICAIKWWGKYRNKPNVFCCIREEKEEEKDGRTDRYSLGIDFRLVGVVKLPPRCPSILSRTTKPKRRQGQCRSHWRLITGRFGGDVAKGRKAQWVRDCEIKRSPAFGYSIRSSAGGWMCNPRGNDTKQRRRSDPNRDISVSLMNI